MIKLISGAILCINLLILVFIYILLRSHCKKNEPYLTLGDLDRKIKSVKLDLKKKPDPEYDGPTGHLRALMDRRRYLYLSSHKTGASVR